MKRCSFSVVNLAALWVFALDTYMMFFTLVCACFDFFAVRYLSF